MHIKAIRIKEKLLGPDDFEVALSVGHLASLYNYDMQKYDEAEQLYIRSIRIGTYSSIESMHTGRARDLRAGDRRFESRSNQYGVGRHEELA